MAKVKLTAGVKVGDNWYKPGDVFEGDRETVDYLIESGAARDPKADADKVIDTSAADAKAAAIVAEAEKQLEQAKADAEKIRSDAQDEAKKAPESKTNTQSK